MRWLIAHWGDDKKHVFDGVTSALYKLGHECVFIPRHDASRRQELLDAIQFGGFSGMLTWQRFYPMQHDLLEVVRTSSLPTVFMDYGFYPHYETVVFDTQGENAVSTWPALWRSGFAPPDAIYEQRAMSLIRERATAARCLLMPEELFGIRFPFVFVALQRPQDSVVRYDSNVHDFGEFLRRVLLLVQDCLFVLCKTHPLDRNIELGVPDQLVDHHLVLRLGNSQRNETICDYLLSRSALVLSVNSNMLFRGLLFGTPCVATGRGWFTGSGAVHEIDGLSNLQSLRFGPLSFETQLRYIATCLSRQLHFDELRSPSRVNEVFTSLGLSLSKW